MATIRKSSGLFALALAAALAVFSVATSTEAAAQHRRHPAGVSRGVVAAPGRPVVRGGYRGAYRGGYRRGGGWNRGGAAAAGIIGGLALGALAAGAMAPPPPPYYAPRPVYYPGDCVLRRERYWNGYRWRIRRVRVCY